MTATSAVPADVKIEPKRRSTAHPHPYLAGNFYPVFEETVGEEGIECEVIGVIPESLRGSQYIRTVANFAVKPNGILSLYSVKVAGNDRVKSLIFILMNASSFAMLGVIFIFFVFSTNLYCRS
ncbi:hypothetical protein BGZ68_010883 [Mortierella alpina]|nr:hypothetical protein BGZ68_010883 [Mortierella alpina]